MASDVLHHHQHPLRAPASAAVSGAVRFNGGQPIIINLATADAATADHAAPSSNAADATPSPVPATVPSLRSLLMSCESSLPFVFIILAKLLYDHRLGIDSLNASIL